MRTEEKAESLLPHEIVVNRHSFCTCRKHNCAKHATAVSLTLDIPLLLAAGSKRIRFDPGKTTNRRGTCLADVGLNCSCRYNRRIPGIDELMRLPVTYKAGLRREEVIAVVLYTGPLVLLLTSLPYRLLGQSGVEAGCGS